MKAWRPTRFDHAAGENQPNYALSVPRPRLQKLTHAIVIDAHTRERVSHRMSEVEITETDGIGITARTDADLGGRPYPDTAHARQKSFAFLPIRRGTKAISNAARSGRHGGA